MTIAATGIQGLHRTVLVGLGWGNKNILVRLRHKKYFVRFRKKQLWFGLLLELQLQTYLCYININSRLLKVVSLFETAFIPELVPGWRSLSLNYLSLFLPLQPNNIFLKVGQTTCLHS